MHTVIIPLHQACTQWYTLARSMHMVLYPTGRVTGRPAVVTCTVFALLPGTEDLPLLHRVDELKDSI